MNILALDPASTLGFAYGESGTGAPISGAVLLKKSAAPVDKAFINLGIWLRDHFRDHRPDLLCIEHFLSPKHSLLSENAIFLAVGLYAVASNMAGLYSITFVAPSPDEVRNFCCGKARALPSRKPGSGPRSAKERAEAREATKQMVLQRARLLKLIPEDCSNDNQADAALIWFFAGCRYARQAPRELYLFGETA